MITFVVVALLAVVAFAYVALPLLSPRHADPLPDDSDPVLTGLQEEKTALLRAIAELDVRTDLSDERRAQLRQRYEAKAAATIRALDARAAELASRGARRAGAAPPGEGVGAGAPAGGEAVGADASAGTAGPVPAGPVPASARRRRAPVAALSLLALGVAAAAFLPAYVLPRVGQDANVTTTDVEAAQLIRDLRRAADREPTAENLLALGDAYVTVGQLEDARAAYLRAVEGGQAPLAVYQRLAVLALQTDLGEAQAWLERAGQAAPDDGETLFLLSEVAYANGDMATSEAALRRYVELLGSAPNDTVAARLELFERVDDLTAAVEAEPTEENLLELADLYWRAGDRRGAAAAYLRVLTEANSQTPVALSRMGQAMLDAGAPNDAVTLLERAAAGDGGVEALEPSAQLALGGAYLQLGRDDDAVTVLEAYQAGGGADPVAEELLARARGGGPAGSGQPAGEGGAGDLSAVSDPAGLGSAVYSANCAECHGPGGEGGMGTALAGNPRAADEANVRDAVTFGRGMMPGFGATLSQEEIAAVVDHVAQVLSRR